MALLQINLLSRSLMRTVPVTVVLPADKMTDVNAPLLPEKKYPTLYLLHGIFGSTLDWLSGTCIERYATEHDLCVVMRPRATTRFMWTAPARTRTTASLWGRSWWS